VTPSISRRALAGTALGAGAAGVATTAQTTGASLGARSHFYARPQFRDALAHCLTSILGCTQTILPVPGFPEPILAFSFPGGGSVSVEFTPDALDEIQMRRGAWLEVRSEDPKGLQAAILAAGLVQIHYPATRIFYFAVPGGQVFSIVAAPKT